MVKVKYAKPVQQTLIRRVTARGKIAGEPTRIC